jgi:DNA helicase IV
VVQEPAGLATSPDDPAVAAEIALEQAYVTRVYAELETAAARARTVAADGHRRAGIDRHDFYREDDQATGLFERDVFVHHAAVRLAALESAHEGLVFGRLDLETPDPGSPTGREVRYIGRLGVRDDDFNPLVIDWRAPAAGAFYQATPVAPLGVIRRRVLRSRGDRIVGLEDDLMAPDAPGGMVVIGDGALMAAISRSRDGTMRDIVATIQADQDLAIRAPWRGVTEITGGPGTGKTVVALHRAAYLLYTERRRFESGGVLVVGPSAAFSAYIDRVLPSLGEDAVAVRSLGQMLPGVTAVRHDPAEAAAVKGSLAIRRVLSRMVGDVVPGAPAHLRVYVAGRIVDLSSGDLDDVRRLVLRHNQRNRAMPAVRDALAARAWRSVQAHENPETRDDFTERFLANDDVADFLDEWWPVLDPREVLLWLADDVRADRYTDGLLDPERAAALRRSYLEHNDFSVEDVALIDELAFRLGSPTADDEDDEAPAAPLTDTSVEFDDAGLSLQELSTWQDRNALHRSDFTIRPIGVEGTFAHIVVDEAQDLSPMQWRMLGRRGRHSSWTVVGDAAQSSWSDPQESRAARDSAFEGLDRRAFKLTRNYRNAAEVFELAAGVILRSVPDADVPEAVRTTGIAPELVEVEPAAVVASTPIKARALLGAVHGSVAVVAATSMLAEVREALGALTDDPRLVVIDPLTAKGLEYDAVLVVEPDRIVAETPGGVRALYVALTRAAHRLTTLGSTSRWRS